MQTAVVKNTNVEYGSNTNGTFGESKINESVFFQGSIMSRPTFQQRWDSPDQNRYLGKEFEPDEGLEESRLLDKELVVVRVDIEGF
jgi:hypothetical protein